MQDFFTCLLANGDTEAAVKGDLEAELSPASLISRETYWASLISRGAYWLLWSSSLVNTISPFNVGLLSLDWEILKILWNHERDDSGWQELVSAVKVTRLGSQKARSANSLRPSGQLTAAKPVHSVKGVQMSRAGLGGNLCVGFMAAHLEMDCAQDFSRATISVSQTLTWESKWERVRVWMNLYVPIYICAEWRIWMHTVRAMCTLCNVHFVQYTHYTMYTLCNLPGDHSSF